MCPGTLIILQPGRLRPEDDKVETSVGYIMRPYLKTNRTEERLCGRCLSGDMVDKYYRRDLVPSNRACARVPL